MITWLLNLLIWLSETNTSPMKLLKTAMQSKMPWQLETILKLNLLSNKLYKELRTNRMSWRLIKLKSLNNSRSSNLPMTKWKMLTLKELPTWSERSLLSLPINKLTLSMMMNLEKKMKLEESFKTNIPNIEWSKKLKLKTLKRLKLSSEKKKNKKNNPKILVKEKKPWINLLRKFMIIRIERNLIENDWFL